MKLDTRARLFFVLAALFITCLLVGNLIGGKLHSFTAFGTTYTISVGLIPFPVVFLLTDLLNEFYGQRATRFVTLVAFAMDLATVGILWITSRVSWAPFTLDAGWRGFNPESWERVFRNSIWMLIASAIAYLISQMLDIGVFHVLKRATSNRMLWLRATGSTVASQMIDTLAITFLAFYGKAGMSVGLLLKMCLTAYTVKLVVAIALTPLIYGGHAVVERVLGLHPVVLGPDGEPVEEAAKPAVA